MEINEKANIKNISRYKVYKNDSIYTCVICGKKVTLDDAFSNQGERLICRSCAIAYFGNDELKIYFEKMFNWMEGKEDGKKI